MVTGAQDDLTNRFRFSARIISLNGRDALRELNGFYFIVDDSLTIYEFRQFGTRYVQVIMFVPVLFAEEDLVYFKYYIPFC